MSDLNDPRVFFAAERTLLAWNRTALALMAFGFAIERFGLFLRMMVPGAVPSSDPGFSFWIGAGLVVLGSVLAILAVLQYRKVLVTLKPAEIPERYAVNLAVFATLAVAALGLALALHLFITGR